MSLTDQERKDFEKFIDERVRTQGAQARPITHVWLDVGDARIETREGSAQLRVQLKSDREDRGAQWFLVEDGAQVERGAPGAATTQQRIREALDKKRAVLAGIEHDGVQLVCKALRFVSGDAAN